MNLNVEGAVNITVVGNADITCPQSTINGNAIVNGDTTMNGNLTVTGNTRVEGTMSAGVVKADNGATGTGDVVTYDSGIVTG